MNNDGWGFMGAGPSDKRIAGEDLQHYEQARTADENPSGEIRKVTQSAEMGGLMKQALDAELARHKESKGMRLKHLEDHYKRGDMHGVFDMYQKEEFEPSWASQLDKVGMQPHSREYLENEMNCLRSERKFEMIAGQMIDYPEGIQFSGKP